jgi:hypothetical protein
MRTEKDTLKLLKENDECAICIRAREEFPELDLIVDKH